MFKKTLVNIHKVVGSLLSLLFLIWSISGLVLIFQGFPHASRQERFEYLSEFKAQDFDKIISPLSNFKGRVELEKYQGEPVYRVYKGRKKQKVYDASTGEIIKYFSLKQAQKEAEGFVMSNIKQSDILQERNMWIPWKTYEYYLPIYKLQMNDKDNSSIYVSSKTGSIVQQTKTWNRILAFVGAIPHKLTIKTLKESPDNWRLTLFIISILGLIVSLTGIITGLFRIKFKHRQTNEKLSVYKQRTYKWHHLFGLFFGVFIFLFMLSASFYPYRVPEWMSASKDGKSTKSLWNKNLPLKAFSKSPKDIYLAIEQKAGIRKIVWQASMGKPSWFIYYNNFQDAVVYSQQGDSIVKTPLVTRKIIENYAKQLFKDDFTTHYQTEYTPYYQQCGMCHAPLPVYRVDIHDQFNTSLYIYPKTGSALREMNNNKRSYFWLFTALHSFKFSIFIQHEILRIIILIIIMLGGVSLSILGIGLAIKHLKRKIKNGHWSR